MEAQESRPMKKALLILNCILLSIGHCGGPLILRLYFKHGGKRIWLSSLLETGGFPIILIPLAGCYLHRHWRLGRQQSFSTTNVREPNNSNKLIFMKLPLFVASAIIGTLTGFDDYFYAYGLARLPLSTCALIIATQLGFTAVFAFFLVKQKFTSYSVNAVVLLTVGAGILAMHTSGDRPAGESNKQYIVGFLTTLAASALYGFILPLVELTYKKAKQAITYTLVLEIQLVMCAVATLVCTIGMLVNNDFKVIPREAREYGLGENKYYLVLVVDAILWQGFFLGAIGVIFCASSLLSGIIIAVLLPVIEILAVIFYKEKFQAEKGVALVLSLWGFVSYFYGEFKQSKNKTKNQTSETEQSEIHNP